MLYLTTILGISHLSCLVWFGLVFFCIYHGPLSDFLCDDFLFVSVFERVFTSLSAVSICGYVFALVLLILGLAYLMGLAFVLPMYCY